MYLPIALPVATAVGFLALDVWLVSSETKLPVISPSARSEDLSVYETKVRECDRQVAIFMSTHDRVELERARLIIDWFRCSVGQRLQHNPRD